MYLVVDYGLGNHGSILNMFKKIGIPARVSSDCDAVRNATALVLPGVGAFDRGMSELANRGLQDVLSERVQQHHTPVLGICLGMQLMAQASEEGQRDGLGWLNARVVRFQFPTATKLKIPHMGWNVIRPTSDHPLIDNLDGSRFYFVHSYHMRCEHEPNVAATATYGYEFTAVVANGHIMGTQFHPEKSHRFGMAILRNFVRYVEYVQAKGDSMLATAKRRAG